MKIKTSHTKCPYCNMDMKPRIVGSEFIGSTTQYVEYTPDFLWMWSHQTECGKLHNWEKCVNEENN